MHLSFLDQLIVNANEFLGAAINNALSFVFGTFF